jgi:hypothetical protein
MLPFAVAAAGTNAPRRSKANRVNAKRKLNRMCGMEGRLTGFTMTVTGTCLTLSGAGSEPEVWVRSRAVRDAGPFFRLDLPVCFSAVSFSRPLSSGDENRTASRCPNEPLCRLSSDAEFRFGRLASTLVGGWA